MKNLYQKKMIRSRYKIYQQADQLMMKDAPVVPLWYDMVIWLVHPYVKNFIPNGLNLIGT